LRPLEQFSLLLQQWNWDRPKPERKWNVGKPRRRREYSVWDETC